MTARDHERRLFQHGHDPIDVSLFVGGEDEFQKAPDGAVRLRTIENPIGQQKFFFKRDGHRVDQDVLPAERYHQHVAAKAGFPERVDDRPVVNGDGDIRVPKKGENARDRVAAPVIEREYGLIPQIVER